MFSISSLPRTLAACQADLANPNVKVRLDVLRDLSKMGDESERSARVRLLVSTLRDESGAVRRGALLALADNGAPGIEADVLPLLKDPVLPVRQLALLCLGEVASLESKEVLNQVRLFLGSEHGALRYQALLAISQLSPESLSGDLLDALDDEDEAVRELSLRLVDEVLHAGEKPIPESIKSRVIDSCEDSVLHVRLVAQLVAGSCEWDAPRAMISQIVRRRVKVHEARDEQQAIVLAGRLQMRELIASLGRRAYGWFGYSVDPFRWVALAALARMNEEVAWTRLLQALNSRRAVERTLAVEGLAESARKEALPILEDLRGDESQVESGVLELALKSLNDSLRQTL